MDFQLHERLAADTVFITDWPLSRLLLMNDVRFPWLILVPRRVGASEVFDLNPADRAVLQEEIYRVGKGLKAQTGCDKINIGVLGNMVPQLHVHVVARNKGDGAWPGPVWGSGPAIPYELAARDDFLLRVVNGF
ncbi:MAG: HIT domain-containing protein [Alphaproteobacteria bacterium]|nr:HIT domain-containing protein [Alphaproteobacteria bacterium]MDE1985272.1 HIT domain-containing protein [Alphaproteobacteria bacterium]MDE2162611.1 HIT domain-containing protein [Alphaproteobacteria bacterium]MDE2266794.1 HIT domain-containing protein [Alphaproteobacteria bacterium]MDE2498629.1 HIT domain-containing protein [Alphaproteobacteria bacterium]